MKEGILFFVIVFLIYNTSAISSDLKATYDMGETIIGEISGEIISGIEKNKIELRREHVGVPFEYDIKRLGDKYYIWLIAPKNEGDYSLIIRDISTFINGKISEIDFIHNFSTASNFTDYFIKPGFIFTDKEFDIETILNEDNEKNVSIDFPLEKEIILKPGKNILKFSLDSIKKTEFVKIKIGKYIIPAYLIFSDENQSSNKTDSIRIEPNAIISTAFFNNNLIYPFKIFNLIDKRIESIKFIYNKDLFLLSYDNISIGTNDIIEINISFIGIFDSDKRINDKIIIINDENVIELPIIISFTENESEAKTPYLEGKLSYYCRELNGTVCSSNEICSTETKASIDGACCIGKCIIEDKKEGKSWIGYIIAVFLLILVIYVFLRYRSIKKVEGFSKRVSSAERKMEKLP